jgi:hypothetical protein
MKIGEPLDCGMAEVMVWHGRVQEEIDAANGGVDRTIEIAMDALR